MGVLTSLTVGNKLKRAEEKRHACKLQTIISVKTIFNTRKNENKMPSFISETSFFCR